jgi:hypothetical protein
VRRLLIMFFLVMIGGVAITLAQDTEVLKGIEDVEFVAWITGPESANQTDVNYDIDGTDLGSMFDLNGTVYIAFGDTFSCLPSGEWWRR